MHIEKCFDKQTQNLENDIFLQFDIMNVINVCNVVDFKNS